MKPTAIQIEQEATIAHKNNNRKLSIDFKAGFKAGANWAISQMQPEWVALEKENENLRKTIELAISGLEMYNNTGGLYVDIKLALRASIGMELITVNGDIDARPQPPTK